MMAGRVFECAATTATAPAGSARIAATSSWGAPAGEHGDLQAGRVGERAHGRLRAPELAGEQVGHAGAGQQGGQGLRSRLAGGAQARVARIVGGFFAVTGEDHGRQRDGDLGRLARGGRVDGCGGLAAGERERQEARDGQRDEPATERGQRARAGAGHVG